MGKRNYEYSSRINDMILNIKDNTIIQPSSKGYAKNAYDFFDQMIKWQFENKETIKFIHNSILEYIKCPNAVFPIRLYGSASKDKYNMLRRGFLSEYEDGTKTLFCDNTFAMPFAALKLYNKCYKASDLIEHLNQKNVVCGFGSTTEEKELTYYICNGSSRINLNTSGWYLAHIIPVGYDFSGKQHLSHVFKNPNRSEWSLNTEHIRHVDRKLNDNEYSILLAHFVRLIHPLNSFLIPKTRFVAYAGKRLGEEQELINIVQNYIKAEFPKEYSELKDIMQIPEQNEVINPVGEIDWSVSEYEISKRRSIILKNTPSKASKKSNKIIDKYDEDEENILYNKLRSIGKAMFIKLYPLVKNNLEITVDEIERHFPKLKVNSTCLSSTRSIIRNGLDVEALEIIATSSRVNSVVCNTAKEMLKNLSGVN